MPIHPFRRAVAFTATTAAVCALALSSASAASAAIVPTPIENSATAGAALNLDPIGTYDTNQFDESAAEIVQAYRDRLFVVNAQLGSVDVLDNSDPTAITKEFALSSEGVANSLAIRDDGLGVVAFEAEEKTDPGHLVFFDANATDAASAVLGEVTVGALPDMVTISKDGTYAVIANEGEPADDFSVDPEGSVSVVKLPAGIAAPAADAVKSANFRAFEAGGTKVLDPKVRVFGPDVAARDQGTTPLAANRVSRNLEPEYITTSGTTAYVALQEANAIAVVDLAKVEVTKIMPLGFKDYATATLDASDRDPNGAPTYNQKSYPGLYGVYMPDGINSYVAADGKTYLVTANEGDAREWGAYVEPARVKDLGKNGLAPVCADSPLASKLGDADLGRLNVTTSMGLNADGTCYSQLYTFGGRSFSVWTTDGALVFDSGSQIEEITHTANPAFFNSNHTESNLEGRSDDKGPEPENLAIGVVNGKTYAFVGLERVGGVIAYDITDAAAPKYVTYINNRNFAATPGTPEAGDLGPEGIAFISELRSPTGTPLLAVGNEVSGSTTVYEIADLLPDTEPDVQVLTINDFHGRIVQEASNGYAGAAALAGAVDAYRAQNANTLFVSAGDNIGASAFESFIQKDEPTLDALAAASLDVSAVGNHEFDQGFGDIKRVTDRLGGLQYALGANVYEKGTKNPALEPYTIETTESGARIAFIGVVTPQTATLVNPAGIASIEFGDMTEAVERETAEIVAADAADVIIVLAHDGAASPDCTALQNDTTTDFGTLVHNAPADVDAIVSGHTHQKYSCVIDGLPVIQAQQYGTTLGTLDIDLNAQKEVVSVTPGLVSLYDAPVSMSAAYPNAEVAQIVAEAKASADVAGREEVGTITADITRAKLADGVTEDRGSHSTLGNTVADVYLWATSENPGYGGTDAEIAFMNPGGLRADLLYNPDNGSVSYREAANVQPFGNTLVTLELTPAQIKAVLEKQWQPGMARPKLALGVSKGFTFEYDPTAAEGSHIKSMQLNGVELKLDDTTTKHRIVTNSFLAAGGDNFDTFTEGTGAADSGQIDLQATVDYFAAIGAVSPAPANRAYLVGEQPPVEGQPGTEEPTPAPQPTLPGTGPATPPTPVNPGGTPPAAGVQTGGTWADVALSNGGRVEQGGTLSVTVSDLDPGQQISATLFSDPIVVGAIPAANASGTTTFAIAIPADFDLGAHRLVITAAGEDPISVGVTVVSRGALAATGAELPWGIALGGAALLLTGGLAFALRSRRKLVS
ncbi:choice-of-anchor I family protein [Microbacterium sp. P04]|uniref:choice-of-anchor I family protein n=1 Tax=Microbacterium sp. P04 TaxID=3366947 RepID=UPI00374681F5